MLPATIASALNPEVRLSESRADPPGAETPHRLPIIFGSARGGPAVAVLGSRSLREGGDRPGGRVDVTA
jgi:hypothetical protein